MWCCTLGLSVFMGLWLFFFGHHQHERQHQHQHQPALDEGTRLPEMPPPFVNASYVVHLGVHLFPPDTGFLCCLRLACHHGLGFIAIQELT